jgi:hypothetical protein
LRLPLSCNFTARHEEHSGNVSQAGYKKGKARNAYYSHIAYEDEIWARYSGKVYNSSVQDDFLSNNIIVFNWNGDPYVFIQQIFLFMAWLLIERGNGGTGERKDEGTEKTFSRSSIPPFTHSPFPF